MVVLAVVNSVLPGVAAAATRSEGAVGVVAVALLGLVPVADPLVRPGVFLLGFGGPLAVTRGPVPGTPPVRQGGPGRPRRRREDPEPARQCHRTDLGPPRRRHAQDRRRLPGVYTTVVVAGEGTHEADVDGRPALGGAPVETGEVELLRSVEGG